MLQPPGFCQDSISTSLGAIVYYSADRSSALTAPDLTAQSPEAPAAQAELPMVFLHGFGGGSSAYEWSKVYPAFVPDYRVIAPDLLGWGRSHHLTRPYQIEDYLTTIREFLEQLSSSPAIVVASSLTAALAVRVAVSHPGLFRSLILSAPTGLADFGQPYQNPLAQLVSIPVIDRLLYSTAIANPLGIRTFLEQRQFAQSNRISPEIIDAYLASALQPNAEHSALSFVRGDLCFDLAQYFPNLTVPTAIFWGQQAQLSNSSLAQRFVELNPRIIKAVEILEGVGLTPQLELPGVTIGVIRQFLAELSR